MPIERRVCRHRQSRRLQNGVATHLAASFRDMTRGGDLPEAVGDAEPRGGDADACTEQKLRRYSSVSTSSEAYHFYAHISHHTGTVSITFPAQTTELMKETKHAVAVHAASAQAPVFHT